MLKKVFSLSLLLLFYQLSFSQSAKKHWVDSVYQEMNANQRIGQLFMIPVGPTPDDQAVHEIENRIKSHEVGGLIFGSTNPLLQVNLINHFQSISDTPLLIALESDMSALDSILAFPAPAILGAVRNDTLVYQIGSDLAQQLKAIGVNLFIGLNPAVLEKGSTNKFSSFGEDPDNVTRKSLALMRGLQDNGVLVSTTAFPLKNVNVLTVEDEVPVIDAQADSLQRLPYAALVAQNLAAISGDSEGFSFNVTENESVQKTGFSAKALASAHIGAWVRKNLQFTGLSLVDSRKLHTGSPKEKPGDADYFAFQMGDDLILYPEDLPAATRKIKKTARKSSAYEDQLEHSVLRILEAKFDAGLWQKELVSPDNLMKRLSSPDFLVTKQKASEASVTILNDHRGSIPVKILETKSFGFLASRPEDQQSIFFEYLKKYVNVSFYNIKDNDTQLAKKLARHTILIVPLFHDTQPDVTESIKKLMTALPESVEIIYCDFGSPALEASTGQLKTAITAYVDTPETQRIMPQIIFGALPANGVLPFSISASFHAGIGLQTKPLDRLSYSLPEDAKMQSATLARIDSIANEAIRIHATPGCQVWVARKGKVIYEKSFGTLTYEDKKPVTSETIYDLASVTKVMATLQTAMFMEERGVIDLHRKVSYYLPELKKSNKKDITILDMLTHQSGLVPFIPMYPQTVKDTTFLPIYYSRKRDQRYPLQVASNLYASMALRDSVWSWVVKSKLNEKPVRTPYSYKYSDLGFLILQHLAEHLLNQPLDEFMQQNYYEPLGAYTTGFNPLNRFTNQNIAPTEDDKIYRKSFVSGTVHDERAAMMGGVAGHAGLFSNANDLGKMGQMLLQEGGYGGIQYYKPETVSLFTAKRFKPSRRGIGWDKPVQSDPNSPASLFASPKTFGHTGFTGTCIWIDPEFDLVFIFLSNRVYPDRNNKLSNANIRTRIQDVIYQSIFEYVDQKRQPYIVNDYAINTGTYRPIE
jgi:beta-N-acetylhexosaminidase